MGNRVKSISDVVEKQLCTGCGACAYMEPDRFHMGDAIEFGRRPFLNSKPKDETGEALSICPGISLNLDKSGRTASGIIQELYDGWGPVLGVWEGYACDNEIRFAGSSGGAATAISLYCMDHEGMGGTLHTASKKNQPYLNESVVSTSREELLSRAGSRYAPASPVEALNQIESADSKSVFIGKPCDVAAVQSSRKLRPKLDENLGLVIAFFCAGVPSLKGNFELLKREGLSDPSDLKSLRYRGQGWPGNWVATHHNGNGISEKKLTYAESWGFLQKYRQWRCYICPDHTGEFADISVGDPWYRKVKEGELGKSLIIARTKKGLDVIKKAEQAGYLKLEISNPELLPLSQPNLLETRGGLFARLVVLRAMGVSTPQYNGFKLLPFWLSELSLKSKFRSVFGTIKRVYIKKLKLNIKIEQWLP